MQFMLLCCADEQHWYAIEARERDRIMHDYRQWVDDCMASGHYVTGGKLADSPTARTVRHERVSDGPFAETREQIGGFHILECADFDEALALAARIPTLPAGSVVEVRPMVAQLGKAFES